MVHQVVARHRQPGQRVEALGLVDLLQVAGRRVGQQVGPDVLRLADGDRVAVLGHALQVEEGVRAAQHDRNAAVAEPARDVIGAVGVDGPGADRHHVDVGLEVDVLELLVDQLDVPARRRERRQIGQGQPHHGAALGLVQVGLFRIRVERRLDDQQLVHGRGHHLVYGVAMRGRRIWTSKAWSPRPPLTDS